jgi:hypothetical protein
MVWRASGALCRCVSGCVVVQRFHHRHRRVHRPQVAFPPPNTAATATRKPTSVAPVGPLQLQPRPWYLKQRQPSQRQKGIEFSRHCEGCHDPIAWSPATSPKARPKRRPFDEDGVTCTVCHSIQKVDTRGTGSYVLGVPPSWSTKNGKPIYGPSPTMRSSPTSTATPRPS